MFLKPNIILKSTSIKFTTQKQTSVERWSTNLQWDLRCWERIDDLLCFGLEGSVGLALCCMSWIRWLKMQIWNSLRGAKDTENTLVKSI